MSNYTSGVLNRRTRALSRLKEQLNQNTKPVESARLSGRMMQDLDAKDIVRINKEIKTLQERI